MHRLRPFTAGGNDISGESIAGVHIANWPSCNQNVVKTFLVKLEHLVGKYMWWILRSICPIYPIIKVFTYWHKACPTTIV